jgi:hypothetical protein
MLTPLLLRNDECSIYFASIVLLVSARHQTTAPISLLDLPNEKLSPILHSLAEHLCEFECLVILS